MLPSVVQVKDEVPTNPEHVKVTLVVGGKDEPFSFDRNSF